MVQLSFIEEVKDRASRLIPTAYMEIVEECTAPHLSVPVYEHVMFLCESTTTKPSALGDIVRALRRRITDANPAVKQLLVMLLDTMVKNCNSHFHAEVCSQMGLLRDLVNLAADPPTSARGMQAKEAALILVLNLSVWFAGHPDPNCHIMTTLANDVRAVSGPNAFEGIRPDNNTQLRITVTSPQRQGGASAGRARRPSQTQAQAHAHRKAAKDTRHYVDAVMIDLPTENALSSMLDSCVTFYEYLNNAQTTPEGDVIHDDIVLGFSDKIRRDLDYITILLSSNLQVDRDVLRSVSDSQSSVLTRLDTRQAPQAKTGGAEQVHMPEPPAMKPESSQPRQRQASPASTPARAPAPAPNMDDIFGAAVPAPAPAAAFASASHQASAMDDIFGSTAAPAAPPAIEAEEAAAPGPVLVVEGPAPAEAPVEAAVPDYMPSPAADDEATEAPVQPAQEEGASAPAAAPEAETDAELIAAAPTHTEDPEPAAAEPVPETAAAVAEPVVAVAPADSVEVVGGSAEAAPASDLFGDDDDFDAFLDSKMNR